MTELILQNRTRSKELGLYFIKQRNIKPTRQNIVVSISHAKVLLSKGYSVDDIKRVIDRVVVGNWKGKDIYSLGYIGYIIDEVLDSIGKGIPHQEKQDVVVEKKSLSTSNEGKFIKSYDMGFDEELFK